MGRRMRAYFQLLDMSGCAVVGVSKVVVMWVKLGYNIMDMDFPSIRPPHGNIVAQVDVSTAVKLIALSSKFKLLHPQSFQHLQDMRHLIYWISIVTLQLEGTYCLVFTVYFRRLSANRNQLYLHAGICTHTRDLTLLSMYLDLLRHSF